MPIPLLDESSLVISFSVSSFINKGITTVVFYNFFNTDIFKEYPINELIKVKDLKQKKGYNKPIEKFSSAGGLPMKLMILDGNSIVNRAFYGVPLLTNAEGLDNE